MSNIYSFIYSFFIENKKALTALILIGSASSILLFGYEFSRSPSIMLFKQAYGTEGLPYIMAIMPLGVILFVYLYSVVLTYLGPRKTLFISSTFSAFLIFLCHIGITLNIKLFTGILYLVREAYVVIIVEQYWSFINSTFKENNAKILNGPLLGLSAIGPIIGGISLSKLVQNYGTLNMLYVCIGATIIAAIISDLAYKFCGEPKKESHYKNSLTTIKSKVPDYLELKLFIIHPKLILLFLIIIITQVLNTFLELSFQSALQTQLINIDQQTAYSGLVFSKINMIAALAQFVFAPLILKLIPLPIIHLLIPTIHLVACVRGFLSLSLSSISLSYILFKSLDYSLFRSAKEILYIPFPFEVRFKAKEIIDVFGYRFGKGFISLVIAIIQSIGFKIAEKVLMFCAVFAILIWIWLIGHFFKRTQSTQF